MSGEVPLLKIVCICHTATYYYVKNVNSLFTVAFVRFCCV